MGDRLKATSSNWAPYVFHVQHVELINRGSRHQEYSVIGNLIEVREAGSLNYNRDSHHSERIHPRDFSRWYLLSPDKKIIKVKNFPKEKL